MEKKYHKTFKCMKKEHLSKQIKFIACQNFKIMKFAAVLQIKSYKLNSSKACEKISVLL